MKLHTSPWGKVQVKEEICPGIWSVSTAGHGGYKLDRKMNALVPKELRNPGGWYEEDCEWAKVVVSIPDKFDQYTVKCAISTMERWYSEVWINYLIVKGAV